jgi:hypothetical protein
MANYNGKPLSEYFTSQLEAILSGLQSAETSRNKAASHEKFKKMEFPPPNPAFLELKTAIEEELKVRKNA